MGYFNILALCTGADRHNKSILRRDKESKGQNLKFCPQHVKGANHLCQFGPTYQVRHCINRTERAGQKKKVLVFQVLFGEFEVRIVAGLTAFWEGLPSWASKTQDFSKNTSVAIFNRKGERDEPR